MLSRNLVIGIVVAIVAIAALAVAYVEANASPVVAVGDNVSVYYTGTFTNGTVFNTNVNGQLFNFTVGSGQVIQGFDSAVVGMKAGQNKTVTIPANEAYGEVNPGLIENVSRSYFGNQTVQVGMTVTSTSNSTNAGTHTTHGVVTAVNSTTVTVNFNSPLAGKTLVFTIHVVKISR